MRKMVQKVFLCIFSYFFYLLNFKNSQIIYKLPKITYKLFLFFQVMNMKHILKAIMIHMNYMKFLLLNQMK